MAEDRKFEFVDGKFRNRVSGEAIPDDEPVFIFRARDIYALTELQFYRNQCADEYHRRAMQENIDAFGAYNPGRLYLTEEDYREDERRHALWQRFHVCLSKRFWPHKGLTSDAILQAADALGIRSEVE